MACCTHTKAQLRDMVLQELGVLAAGETATAEDAELVECTIEAQHAMLRKEVFVDWDLTAIPLEVIEPLMQINAARLCGRFGLSTERRQELLSLAVIGMAALHTQCQTPEGSSDPVYANYY
jgi:hypothetical protein